MSVTMSHEEWEIYITAFMTSQGWVKDRDDETTLGFSFKDSDGGHWVRDYDKKTKSFVQFDANQKVRLKCTSLKESADTLVEGIKHAYQNCPHAKNKTFEQIAEWAGQHVVLTDRKLDKK